MLKFGRHVDAIKLQEEELAFRKRFLPVNHLDIATSMGHLASSYSALGLHDDALNPEEKELAFRKRVLPANLLDIAKA
eukprot:IDg8583t1